MWKTLSYLVGAVLSIVAIITQTRSGDALTNALSWVPTLPPLVRALVIMVSVMVGAICFGALIIRLFRKRPIDELSGLKAPMAKLRIEMESDPTGTVSFDTYKQETEALREQVASKIAAVSGDADADNYLTCGNLTRRRTAIPHRLYIDILIRDLDFLTAYIDKRT